MLSLRLIVLRVVFVAHSSFSLSLEVLYTANRQGSIEPCGCTTGQIGGLDRMADWVASKKGALLFDAGDTFFSAPTLNPMVVENEAAKAKLIAKSYREMGVTALTPGERDFALGVEALAELQKLGGFKILSVNLRDPAKRLTIDPFVILDRGGSKVAIVGVSDPEGIQSSLGLVIDPAAPALEAIWETKIKSAKPNVIILLSHLGLPQDQEMAKKFKPDAILGAHTMDALEKPLLEGATSIYQPSLEGQAVGSFKWENGKIAESQWVPLEPVFQKQNGQKKKRVRKLMDEYYEQSKKRERSAASPGKPKKETTASFVANPNRCKQCHAVQYDFWEKTKHSSAMLVLYAKGRHLDSECIGCHTLGFGDPRGFERSGASLVGAKKQSKGALVDRLLEQAFEEDSKEALDSRAQPERYARLKKRYHQKLSALEMVEKVSKNFLGVQCEHCHGNRNAHVRNPGRQARDGVSVSETCLKCHTTERSPAFTPDWKARIACPLVRG